MTSRKKGGEKEDMKDKPDWVDNLEKRLTNVIENQNEVLLKRMAEMESKVNDKIGNIQLEMKNYTEKIKKVEQKTNNLEVELKEENRKLQDQLVTLECKMLENCMRFRGVPESENNVWLEMIEIISEFLEMSVEEVEKDCVDIYKVNSDFARQKNLPRDIIVKVVSHKLRDMIFSKQYQEPLEVSGKKIKIWREFPKEVVKQRKEFKLLTDSLRREQIRYRWEIPRGVSFLYNKKKLWIKNDVQMSDFLKIL